MKQLNLLDEEWEFLTGFLPKDWREKARTMGALRRARGIIDADALLQIILMHTATGLSLRQTVVRAREQNLADISDVALLKRLHSSEAWLKWMTSEMTQTGQKAIVRQVSQKRRIRVVDATTVEEQGGAGTDWRLHYTLRLPDLSCDFFQLTDKHGGETYRRIPVEPRDLLLADQGYSNAPGVVAIQRCGGDVLVRWNCFSFPLKTIDEEPFEPLQELSKLPKRGFREWPVCFLSEGKKYSGRLCAIRKSVVATAKAQEKLRRQAKKKQKPVNDKALRLAEFILVFTTVGVDDLSTKDILELYRVRWQIELRFKHLKSLLGLGCLPKYDKQSCRAWIQAKLLCGLLIERLMKEAEFFFPWGYRLSTAEPLEGIY
ncbi:MAG: IS4 family transposase [Verrucomicrobia bacterium]|nr:IS4 family transposase [Verrucomicrobiota bacterium]